MKKKSLKLAMLVFMFFTMMIPATANASAHEHEIAITKDTLTPIHASKFQEHAHNDAANIAPRVALCGRCMSGSIYTTRSYGTYVFVDYTAKCLHGKPGGNDKRFQRTVTTHTNCSYCGVLDSTTSIEYKYECHGYY